MTPGNRDRRPLVAANWKMWGTRPEARSYVERFLPLLSGDLEVDVALCVPFTALATAVAETRGTPVRIAAQNMHQESKGAYTGEVSAPMLVDLGVDAVVLGHSERRQYNGESDRALQEKLPAALAAGLGPILCVGETEEEREAGDTERRLRTQVQEALEKVPAGRLADVAVAYEPVWAIGTGRVASPEQAQEAIAFVRALVGDRDESAAERVRVLYGGSVNPENAGEILSQPEVDGALVGGASLDPASFAEIVAAAR
jgi:triosephosphate isomerase (TIM)